MIDEKNAKFANIIHRLYEVISFNEGEMPDFDGMTELFFPWAHITRITPEGLEEFNLFSFQAMLSELFEAGIYTSFYEAEIARRVEFIWDVAHVLSAYETKSSKNAIGVIDRGINSIQLIWSDKKWRIVSLLWDEGLRMKPAVLDNFQNLEIKHG